jgi:hypothetical protein
MLKLRVIFFRTFEWSVRWCSYLNSFSADHFDQSCRALGQWVGECQGFQRYLQGHREYHFIPMMTKGWSQSVWLESIFIAEVQVLKRDWRLKAIVPCERRLHSRARCNTSICAICNAAAIQIEPSPKYKHFETLHYSPGEFSRMAKRGCLHQGLSVFVRMQDRWPKYAS